MNDVNPRVLLVDDDPALLEALTEAMSLRMPSVAIDTCDAAQRALEQAASVDYDVVISDIKMPGMDGLELLRQIKQLMPDTPMVLITGHGQTDLAIQALRAGAFDLIQKPLDRDYFIAAIKRAMEVRSLKRQVAEQQRLLREHADTLELNIQERTRELEKALRAKDEFLSLVSHELRNPMTVIMGNAEALYRRGDALPAEERLVALTDLRSGTKRLMQLIENLLVMSKAEYGIQESEPVMLDRVVQAQVDWYRQFSADREVRVVLPGKQPPPTICNATHVALVLKNLIGNADKYSPAGEPIDVSLDYDLSHFVITVRDQGPGVLPTDRELIFEPFFRSRATADVNGMGIGLAVCRKLAGLNGGEVWLDDSPGGTTFCFSLPAIVPAAVEEPELELVPPGS